MRFAGVIARAAANVHEDTILEGILYAIESFNNSSMMNDIYRQNAALCRIQKIIDDIPETNVKRYMYDVAEMKVDDLLDVDETMRLFEYLTLKKITTDGSGSIFISFANGGWYQNWLPSPIISRALVKIGQLGIGTIIITRRHFDTVIGSNVSLDKTGAPVAVKCQRLGMEDASVKLIGDVENIDVYGNSTVHCTGTIERAFIDDESKTIITGNPHLIFGIGQECSYFSTIEKIVGNPKIVEDIKITRGYEVRYYASAKYYNLTIDWRRLSGSKIERKNRMIEILNSLKFARNLYIILPEIKGQNEYRSWLPSWLLGPKSKYYEERHDRHDLPYFNIHISWVTSSKPPEFSEISESPKISGVIVTKKARHLCPVAGVLDQELRTVEELNADKLSAEEFLAVNECTRNLLRDVAMIVATYF